MAIFNWLQALLTKLFERVLPSQTPEEKLGRLARVYFQEEQ